MSVDPKVADELGSAIVRISDLLDGLADFGIVMMNLSESSAAGRIEWFEKHLAAIAKAANDTCALASKGGNADLSEAAGTLAEATSHLVSGVSQVVVKSAEEAISECTCRPIVEHWKDACVAVSRIVCLLGFQDAQWWRIIEERRPAYQLLIDQLLLDECLFYYGHY